MHIQSCFVWLKSILFHLLCVFDPLSFNGLSLPHYNAPLCEFLGWRVLNLALGQQEIFWACSVYWVTGPAGLCNKKLIYTPASGVRWLQRLKHVWGNKMTDLFMVQMCFGDNLLSHRFFLGLGKVGRRSRPFPQVQTIFPSFFPPLSRLTST